MNSTNADTQRAKGKKKAQAAGPVKVWPETLSGVGAPTVTKVKPGESLRAVLREALKLDQDLQALWVLTAGAREPYRFPWQMLYRRS